MFNLEEFMGRRVLMSSLIEDDNVVAFFTTRDLPLKYGEREDLIQEIENNKKLICDGLNIPLENLIIPIQTHSDNVEIIANYPSPLSPLPQGERGTSSYLLPSWEKVSEGRMRGQKSLYFNNTDGLITNQPNIALALNFADCVPVIFYDPIKKIIACAHAGWRGTAEKIVVKTVDKMVKHFNSNPRDIIALIGPAIGKCCYGVQDDVLNKLIQTVDTSERCFVYDKNNTDLKLVNKFQLLASGVEKIDLCEDCTCCRNELFFSYRKEKGNTARHSAVIMLKGEIYK